MTTQVQNKSIFHISVSSFPPPAELKPQEFFQQVRNVLDWGKRDHQTVDYITGQVLSLVRQNPKLVKTMDFPQSAEAIKKQVIDPDFQPQQEERLVFEVTTGKLTWYEKDGTIKETLHATTGTPSGKLSENNRGPLPPGVYKFGSIPRSKNPGDENYESFCDKEKNCWSQTLINTFDTTRTDLAIHPDGNWPGTRGCIGLEEINTLEFKNELKKTLMENPNFSLTVIP
jgi:hypothetical protein